MSRHAIHETRASAPAVGTALLVLLAALTAAAVGTAALGVTPDRPPQAALTVDADAATDRIALTHAGGDTLRVADLEVRIAVDGRPLAHQPPVPFFAAEGFESGPTGPFNVATDGRWTAGETASLRPAGTNDPPVRPGARVTVTVYVDGHRLVELETVA